MITLQELCAHLESLLQQNPIEDYCPNGLQIEGQPEIKKIGTTVSASLATIQEAVKRQVQVLIVHHGMFWNREIPLVTGVRKEKIKLLLDHGISLIAYHLPLDIHPELGNNWKAAQEMGWTDLEPFGKYNKISIGVKGMVPKMHRDDFKKKLEIYYGHPAYCALGGAKEITTAALISGGAYRSMEEAIREKVDCFITGNYDEPAWNIAHEGGINFFALGHAATEKIGPKALGKHLAQRYHLSCEFIDDPNPF